MREFFCGEILELFGQGSDRCPSPGNVQGLVQWDYEEPHLIKKHPWQRGWARKPLEVPANQTILQVQPSEAAAVCQTAVFSS